MPSFLDLPREIRDQIYSHCLLVNGEVVAHPAYFEEQSIFGDDGLSRPVFALLCVSRQIHQETATIVYGQNTWHIPNTTRLDLRLELYRNNAFLFRRVSLCFSWKDIQEHQIILYLQCTGIQLYRRSGPQESAGDPPWMATGLYAGIHG